jgi:hypothetical protein
MNLTQLPLGEVYPTQQGHTTPQLVATYQTCASIRAAVWACITKLAGDAFSR